MAGNNIPFMPGDAKAERSRAPDQGFGGKHRNPSGNSIFTGRHVLNYSNGKADSGQQPDNMAVLQRAAGKRLLGGKPGAFAASYARNTSG